MKLDNYEAALKRKRKMIADGEAERAAREAAMDAEMAAMKKIEN
jgi:hypothetical protein